MKFMIFIALDLIVVAFCVVLSFINLTFGLLLLACTLPRFAVGCFVVYWRGSVVKLYTKITFHRTELLRRFANCTHHPYLAAWIALSYISAAFVLFLAIVVGIAVITVSFGVSIISGVGAVIAAIFTVGIALYLVITEQIMYSFCVIGVVDGLLDSQDELRRSFVHASAIIHNRRTEELFARKSAFLLNSENRRLNFGNGAAGLARNAKTASSHKAPNRKDN